MPEPICTCPRDWDPWCPLHGDAALMDRDAERISRGAVYCRPLDPRAGNEWERLGEGEIEVDG